MSRLALLPLALVLAGCGQGGEDEACKGPVLTASEGTAGASIAQLMAHSTAMGMTQQEAETLIYLEGLNPQATLKPGESICLDGTPDR